MQYFKFSFILCFFSIMFLTSCQTKKNIVEKDKASIFGIDVMTNIVEVDNLGRIYLVDNTNNIINYGADLLQRYQYANKRSGNVSSMDVSNPLKISVFYDDFNKVKLLDNTLTIISELDLSNKFADISACGSSNDGNLWVFDPVQFKLLKIDDGGNVILETTNVNDFGMTNVQITDIRERGNYTVLCDRNKGFFIFDNLGQYIYTYETIGILSFQFDGRNIFYTTATGLKSYSIKFKERQIIGYPVEINKPGLKYILYNAGDFFEVNKDGINSYIKN